MKVLVQSWVLATGYPSTSISKDHEQLEATIDEFEAVAAPDGDPEEVGIPKRSVLARRVQEETIFLKDDELHIVGC